MTNQSENSGKPSEIRVLINVGDQFIDEASIQSVVRFGKGTKIVLISGQEIVVAASYDRIAEVVRHS
ncbi:MAG: hypothetical protein L6Q81_05535 [Bacteroidia bacterium]|nr:hypothetical protein [Bacteroidia bacterium]